MSWEPAGLQQSQRIVRKLCVIATLLAMVASASAIDRVLLCNRLGFEVLLFENDGGTWTQLSVFADNSVPVGDPGFERTLNRPQAVAVDPTTKNVYIVEGAGSGGGRVLEYASDGTFLRVVAEDFGFVSFGSFAGTGQDLVWGPDNRLYMSTAFGTAVGIERVYAIDPVSTNVTVFVDTSDLVNYTLQVPLGIDFGADGNLYVANRGDNANTVDPPGNDEILVFQGPGGALPGAFLTTFWDQDNKPKAVSVDPATGGLLFCATGPDVGRSFTDLSDSSQNSVIGVAGNAYEILRIGGEIYYTIGEGGGGGSVTRVNADNSTTPVVTGLASPRGFVIFETITADVWDGGGGNDNWSAAANWVDDVTPTFAGSILTFTGNTRLTPNNDIIGASLARLSFDALAGAFTLGGNGFTLTGLLSNSSSLIQTVATAQIVAEGGSLGASAADLDVIAAVNLAGSSDGLIVNGAFTTTIDGVVSGSGPLTIEGPTSNDNGDEGVGVGGSTLLLLTNSANSYTGPTNLSGGVLRITDPSQLGSTSGINVAFNPFATRLDLDGGAGMTLSVPFEVEGRSTGGLGVEDAFINSLTGDNTLNSPLTFVPTTTDNHTSFLFRVDSDSLTVNNAPTVASGFAGPVTIRSDGIGELNLPFAWNDADVPVGIVSRGSVTVNLTNANNNYSDTTRVVGDSTVALAAASTNSIPNSTTIAVTDAGATLDVTGLTNSEIVLTSNNARIDGRGTIAGGVVAGIGTRFTPTGTLTITDGLTLNDGVALEYNAGKEADLIQLTGGTLTGSASAGGILVTINSLEPLPQPDRIPLIDFSGLAAANLEVSDFTLDASAIAADFPNATIAIVDDQVVLDISVGRADVNVDGSVNAADWLLAEPCVFGPDSGLAGSDYALLWDDITNDRLEAQFDTNGDNNNGGGDGLADDVDFSVNPITFSFDIVKRRTGSGKNYPIIAETAAGAEVFRLVWENGGNDFVISTDGGDTVTRVYDDGIDEQYTNDLVWDPAEAWTVELVLDGSGIDVTITDPFGSSGGLVDVVPDATVMGQLVFTDTTTTAVEGIYLDNLIATAAGIGVVFSEDFSATPIGPTTLANLQAGLAVSGVGSWNTDATEFAAADARIVAEDAANGCTVADFLRLDSDCDADVDMADFNGFEVSFTQANP